MNSEIFHLPLTDLGAERDGKRSEPAPDLSKSYGQNRLVALPRDPYCLWIYWEMESKEQEAELRLYFAKNQRLAHKASCRIENANHYLDAPTSGESYYVELGRLDANKRWHPLLKSNIVTLPYGYPAGERASRRHRMGGPGSFAGLSSAGGLSSASISSRRSSS